MGVESLPIAFLSFWVRLGLVYQYDSENPGVSVLCSGGCPVRQERLGRGKSAGSHRRQRSTVRLEDPYQHGFEALVQSYSSDTELLTYESSLATLVTLPAAAART